MKFIKRNEISLFIVGIFALISALVKNELIFRAGVVLMGLSYVVKPAIKENCRDKKQDMIVSIISGIAIILIGIFAKV